MCAGLGTAAVIDLRRRGSWRREVVCGGGYVAGKRSHRNGIYVRRDRRRNTRSDRRHAAWTARTHDGNDSSIARTAGQVENGNRITGRAQQVFVWTGHRHRMRRSHVDRRFIMKTDIRNRERGQAMVETAIAIPLLLVLMVGIFEVGRAYETWQVLTNAAREGARMAVTPTSTVPTTTALIRQYMAVGQLTN